MKKYLNKIIYSLKNIYDFICFVKRNWYLFVVSLGMKYDKEYQKNIRERTLQN